MKNLILALSLFVSVPAFAATECPSDAADVEKMIRAAGSCYDAATIARDCAWGSSIDVMLAGTASETCEKDYAKMSAADRKTMNAMRSRCARKYRDEEGTMYRSMEAHCQLNVSEFWSNIYSTL
jgi:hypothetical protein